MFSMDWNCQKKVLSIIYNQTKRQAQSQVWHDVRTGRITASKAYDILHTNPRNPSKSLIKRICAESKICNTTIPSLKWGIENEKVALDEFVLSVSDIHSNFKVDDCGLLLLSDCPYIGASADGLFTCQCHNEKVTVEVKCPFSHRNTLSLEDALTDSNFCLDSSKNLKTNHHYYAQIQLQMHVYNVDNSYLVIWTPKWLHQVLVRKDIAFITSMLTCLKEFYSTHIIPELLTRKLEYSDAIDSVSYTCSSAKTVFCYCHSEYNDQELWIGCDAVTCKWQWFHLDCVKLKRVPKGKWYCPACRREKKNKSDQHC